MKRLYLGALVVVALILAFAAGGFAASRTYQFTGVVKTVDGANFTVEKSARDTWTFETAKDTKGAPRVGERVTVYYKMIVTEIQGK